MPVGDLLPELAVLGGAVAALLTAMFTAQRRQWIAALPAMAGLLAAAVLVARQLALDPSPGCGPWTAAAPGRDS